MSAQSGNPSQQAPIPFPGNQMSRWLIEPSQPCGKLPEKGLGHLVWLHLNPGSPSDLRCLAGHLILGHLISITWYLYRIPNMGDAGLGSKVGRHAENWKSSTVKLHLKKQQQQNISSSLNCEHQALRKPKSFHLLLLFLFLFPYFLDSLEVKI